MKRKFSFLPILFLLLCANSVNAQEAKRNTVKVQTYSAIKVPADEIIFSINLNVTKQNAQEAYDFHKNKEKDLIPLFKKFEIPDSSVTYSLLNISKARNYKKQKQYFQTRQGINVTLNNIQKYEAFQIALLSNGFNDFRATFSSSQRKKALDDLSIRALEQAKKEAQIIADNLGKKLGEILEVVTQRSRQRPTRGEAVSFLKATTSLIDIKQFIEFNTNITVIFELLE